MTAPRRPNRVLGGEHGEFWRHCMYGELWLQRCAACDLLQWPSVVDGLCERCGAVVAWQQLSGGGVVVNWCTFERAYYPGLEVPYDTILVELDEGALFMSNPKGFGHPDIRRGLRVRVAFVDCEDDAGAFRLPVFERC